MKSYGTLRYLNGSLLIIILKSWRILFFFYINHFYFHRIYTKCGCKSWNPWTSSFYEAFPRKFLALKFLALTLRAAWGACAKCSYLATVRIYRPGFIGKNKDHLITWDVEVLSTWNFHKLFPLMKEVDWWRHFSNSADVSKNACL